MKDLTHYFGQSPKSDESSSSLKENEASSTLVEGKTVAKSPASPDVLKCKTPANNVNTDTESPKPITSNSVSKTQSKKSAAKRKPAPKKKATVNEDDDFEVKPVKRTAKKRAKPKTDKAEAPVLKVDAVPENKSTYGPSKASVGQCHASKLETAQASPTPDDSATETKPKSAKNIMHFFSPTKRREEAQPVPSEIIEGNTEPVSQRAAKNSEESLSQLKEKEGSEKVSACKTSKKLKEEASDFKTNSCKKSFSKDDRSSAKITNGLSSTEEKQNDVKSSVCNAFQMLMYKKQNSQSLTDVNDDSKSEKSQTLNELPEQDDDFDFQESTPKTFAKRKKRNRIESDTDDDCQADASNQQKKKATEVEAPASQDESKRKSLKNYFQKISKEEADIQSQKVQFKVEAIVHHSDGSPYKSKPKKETGSQKVAKKKKAKLKRNEDVIELLSSEVITVEETATKSDCQPKASKIENVENAEKTNTAEKGLDSSLPNKAKRTLKLNSTSSPKSKRQKKAAERVVKEDEGKVILDTPPAQTEAAEQKSLEVDGQPSINTKNPAKKMRQSSLASTFFKKQGSGDPVTAEAVETPVKSETPTSFPMVSLKQMSPRKLKRAANAREVLGTSPMKEGMSSLVPGEVEVVASCEDVEMKSPPRKSARSIFAESPISPTPHPSDVVSPPARSWKMRVCLTPKADTGGTPASKVSETNQTAVSDSDRDVEEIAVVKKRRKTMKSLSSESKEPSPSPKDDEIQIVFEDKEKSCSSKSAFKLAPLFMRPKKLDRISELAKQEFLQSGVPEQVKKRIEAQKSMECVEVELFPQISHVTQLDSVLPWTPSTADLLLKPESLESEPVPSESLKMGDMTACDAVGIEMAEVLSNCSTSLLRQKRRIAVDNVSAVLSLIKSENPTFEVIRYFKRLREKYRKVLDPEFSAAEGSKKKRSRSTRRSRGSNQGVNSPKRVRAPPSLMWTDKYRSTSSNDIVGNEDSVQSLKQWLEGLRRIFEAGVAPTVKPKKPRKPDYEDDFVVSDENFDSNCSTSASVSNCALLLGPHGSGKTNCVYALAADLGYKVLEINASERRSGKIILAKLAEATQSHQVANRSQDLSSAASTFFSSKTKAKPKAGKRKLEKTTEPEEESAKNKLSLILIKDIDIVFEEEDEGFVSAVSSLISTSKRPVIFTTTEADSPPQRRLVNSSTLLLEFTPETNALCSWLQVVALVEGIYISRTALDDLLSSTNNDIRRCLLQLQVWMSTGGNHLLAPASSRDDASVKRQEKELLEEFLGYDVNEDILNAEVNKASLSGYEHHDCIGALQGRNDIELEKDSDRVTLPVPLSFGRLWWNVPHLLSLPQIELSKLVVPEVSKKQRRFKGLFDDSIFDMTSDDEGSPAADAQTKPAENTDRPAENEAKPVEDEPETSLLDVDRCSQEEVDAMLSHLKALSTCDLIATASRLPELSTDLEPIPRSWQTVPRASLCPDIPLTDGPNLLEEDISRSLCLSLAETSIEHTRSIVQENPVPARYNALLPNHEIQRRRLDVAEAEQAVLVGGVAGCAQLERSAIAQDYLPTFRRICAAEQRRLETNCSRRNRFYHYLKGVGLTLSPDQAVILSST